MEYILIVLLVLTAAVFTVSYVCFRIAFYEPDRKEKVDKSIVELPNGEIYEPFREQIEKWALETRNTPCEEVSIKSFDGLKLYGKFYEYDKASPIEIMFHGYRGCAERDLAGGVQRCFNLKHSALIVEQRASGKSDGNVISFGINEHRDAILWARFVAENFGKDRKIILTGISMGAATVTMTADKDLPENVIGILADCGYTSAKDIIKIVIKKMKLPPTLYYPFVKLGAKIYGKFNLEEDSPLQSAKNAKLPIIYFHGDNDDFVPCYMSEENFNATPTKKAFIKVPNAGHGLAYPMDTERYFAAVTEFFKDLK